MAELDTHPYNETEDAECPNCGFNIFSTVYRLFWQKSMQQLERGTAPVERKRTLLPALNTRPHYACCKCKWVFRISDDGKSLLQVYPELSIYPT